MQNFIDDLKVFVEFNMEELRLVDGLQTAITDPRAATREGSHWVAHHLPSLSSATRQTLEVVRDYGRLEHRINYSSVLWYDVVDSTGRKSKRTGVELKLYRQAVASFKQEISKELYGLTKEAARQGASIHVWQGSVFAKDDEKHLFFAGTRSLGWVREAIRILLRRCGVDGVNVRAVAVPANFAGIAAYRYRNDVNVEGEQFWEHLAHVKAQLRALEDSAHVSYLWIGGKLRRSLELETIVSRVDTSARTIITEIEEYRVRTPFVGGITKAR